MYEKQVGYGRRGSGLSGSGRPYVSLLSRLASGLIFDYLVSTSSLVSFCLGFSALVPSCVVCWASPWPVLGDPGRALGSLLAALGPLLARPWAAPGLSGAVLAAPWASFGASWHGFEPSGGPPGPLLAALGWPLGRPKWSWVALGWLLGRPKWSWVLSGCPWSRPWVGPGSPQSRGPRSPVRCHCIDGPVH